MQMADQLLHNLFPGTVAHSFVDEIADFVRIQAVAPEHLDMLRLIAEMRLEGQHNRHEPARILEGDKCACAGPVAGEFLHQVEEDGILEGDGERLPLRFVHIIRERRGITKPWLFAGDVLPQLPGAALAVQFRS
ncbi:hypothetical protein D3C80_1185890 [compost metagenome]